MKRVRISRPKVKMIGGPWLLLLMGVVSLLGLIVTLMRKKMRRHKPVQGDRTFTLSLLNGTWYELAHAIRQDAEERIGVVFSFHQSDESRVRLTRTSLKAGSQNGNPKVQEGFLHSPDLERPWELIHKRYVEADQEVRVLYADVAERVLLLSWDREQQMILLHSHPEMDEKRYQVLIEELKRLGIAVSRLRSTPRIRK
jgi:lipocalin